LKTILKSRWKSTGSILAWSYFVGYAKALVFRLVVSMKHVQMWGQ